MELVKVIEEALKNLDKVKATNRVKAQAIYDAITDHVTKDVYSLTKRDKQ